MKRTPLYKAHLEYGAKLISFSGWQMPLSYSGVTDEHRAVRNAAGLFDVSHMGRFELSGKGSEAYLEKMTPGPVHRLSRGGAQYSMLLNDEGGIIDDIYIYKIGTDHYLLIVNAANRVKDFKWLNKHLPSGKVALSDKTEETGLIALQGPKSWEILLQIIPFGKKEIALRKFIEIECLAALGSKTLIARTGYTGEKGYELMMQAEHTEAIWAALMEAGKTVGIKPVGLGARDTLRLEMGYPLYGHEMDEKTSPVEADLDRFVDYGRDFPAKEKLLLQREKGVRRKLIGFKLMAGGVPREGHLIYSDQKEIGIVTSGNYSPSLVKGIGMAYVDVHYSETGSEILIDIRGKTTPALIVRKPFYKRKKLH
ncbi:MAG: glycine cleavage system aminomethyltransferase GcvT [Nitrospiria bacterium]